MVFDEWMSFKIKDMNDKQNKALLSDAYDWGYLFILINCCIGENTWSGTLYTFLKWPLLLTTLVMFYKYAINYFKRRPQDIKFYLPILAIGVYNYFLIGSAWILYAILIILFSRGRSIIKFMKMTYKIMLLIFIVNIIVFAFRYIFFPDDLVTVYTEIGKKYSMSFLSANEAARNWIYLVFLWHFLHQKTTIFHWIIIAIISMIMYHFTQSDAIFFILILFLLHSFRTVLIIRKYICFYSRYAFTIFALGSFILAYLRHPLILILDKMFFTGRLSQIVVALNIYGLSWFGNPIDTFSLHTYEEETRPLFLDSGYGFMMIKTGMIFLFLIASVFIFSRTYRSYKLSICTLLYAMMTLAENNMLHPTAIFPIVLAFSSGFSLTNFYKSYSAIIRKQ